ncbi:MAG: cytochrome b/b6 domain-containing protein [Ramlibacter sp.]
MKEDPSARSGDVPVWGLAVRACHWSLAALVLAALVRDDGGPLHRWLGYAAAAVVLVRWLAGWTGALGASLHGMRPRWTATRQYAGLLLRGRAPRHPRHDPLGLWMVWLLWALVLALAVTGWMSRLDRFWGDDTLHDVHAWLADAMLAAVLLHVAGVAAMSWHWHENLPRSMLTGRKRPLDSGPGPRHGGAREHDRR